jgi:hypothetical protein
MDRLLRIRRPHPKPKVIPQPMAYYLLRVPLDGVDHFMLEVDADGAPHREIGLDPSGAIIFASADDHGIESRCIWHQLFGWEIETFIQDDSESLTAAQFEALWPTRPEAT